MAQPTHDQPRKGRLEINVEVSPMAFLGQPVEDGVDVEELNAELSKVRQACGVPRRGGGCILRPSGRGLSLKPGTGCSV